MFDPIPPTAKKKLWQHQAKALDFVISHLNKHDSACLVRMPTGTGKTGVIACLVKLSNSSSSLVLTPWRNLRQQMIDDLQKGFWEKVKITPSQLPVVSMFPSTAKSILNQKEPQVIVATFATLNTIRLKDEKTYEQLANILSLVVVDEGHYEPAVEWGKSVKGLKTKTLLLTATPYRNDLKLFRITDSKQSTHHFTHEAAVASEIIRPLGFDDLLRNRSGESRLDIAALASDFAERWKTAKSGKELPSKEPRAIVCCSGHGDIETAVARLRKLGVKAVGLHDQFKGTSEKHLMVEVPDPKKTDYEVWVHQHKLTEGLDDHRFCCLALFTRIRNDRKLVQQIGRILRRDKSDAKKPALVFAPEEYSAQAEWEAYLEFETDIRLLEPKHFRDVVDTLLGAQPNVEYFEGKFRRRFAPNDLNKRPQVIIPPSVLVREVGSKFSLEEYIEDCTDTLNTEDAVILGPEINAPCQKSSNHALWVYASVRNSRFLQDTSLYEIKLETHCIVKVGDLIFLTDSRGYFPLEYLDLHSGTLAAEQLSTYIDKRFRPTNLSVDSSIPYDTVVRGSEMRGHNLMNVPASLTDRVQICRAARGSSREEGRRYLGLSNGRVRKEISSTERRHFEPEAFIEWAKSVAEILTSKKASSPVFRRFMPTCAPPANPVPKSISLDMLRVDLSMTLGDGTECRFKSSSANIEEVTLGKETAFRCEFSVEAIGSDEDVTIALKIAYQPGKKRFWFSKDKGAVVRIALDDGPEDTTKGLAEFLNQKQEIVLIGLEGGDVVYQGRNFYSIDYSYAEEVLLGLIETPSNAPKCASEKGSSDQIKAIKTAGGKEFPAGSLFRAIADRKIGLPFSDEILICDDIGTECADFVAAEIHPTDGVRLALLHAKSGKGSKISASDFHDVVAQAMKNLVYLTRTSEVPEGVGSWSKSDKWNKTKIGRLIRAPGGYPVKLKLWEKLQREIIGSSDPGLYVVLVTTGCCDPTELRKAITNPANRTPEVAQLFHLLDGLNGYARQLGVRLLVKNLP